MSASRDKVNWQGNQRADLGDIRVQQDNDRTNQRAMLRHILFDGPQSTAMLRILGGFDVTATAPATSSVIVAYGSAIGPERQADNSLDHGEVFGRDTVTQRILDFAALGAATYGIFLRLSLDPGSPGARVFYNPDTDNEFGQTIDVFQSHDWDVTIAVTSPGAEWQQIAEVVWNGATVSSGNITGMRSLFFEGDEDNAYANTWGDGANDRDSDRATYGIKGLFDFVAAMRRKIEEIQNDTLFTRWWDLPLISLREVNDHVNETANPHGTVLEQDFIIVNDAIFQSLDPGARTRYFRRPATAGYGSGGNNNLTFQNNKVIVLTGPGANPDSQDNQYPLNLPKSAVLTAVRAYVLVFATAPAGVIDFGLNVYRVARNTAAVVDTTIFGDATPVDVKSPTGQKTIEHTTVLVPGTEVIDNDNYSYMVHWRAFVDNATNAEIWVYSIEVEYEISEYD